MRRLILNADDLGFTPGVTRGILEAHANGIITSTTLMTNMPHAEEALHAAQAYPNLGVGIHLNLTAGPALTGRTSLTDKSGNLPYSNLRRLHQLPSADIEAELRAQIKRFLSWGAHPTHIDSHHGINMAAPVRPLVVRLAQEYNIRAMRTAGVLAVDHVSTVDLAGYAWFLFGSLNLSRSAMRKMLEQMRAEIQSAGIYQTDAFLMGHWFGKNDSVAAVKQMIHKLLQMLPEGTYELLFHPGYVDDELRAIDSLLEPREAERIALTDPEVRAAITNSGVQLTHYGEVA